MRFLGFALYGVLVAAAATATFVAPDIRTFQNPQLARLVFWHLPCALLTLFFLVWGAMSAFRGLRNPSAVLVWDARAAAAWELSWMLGLLTLITGVVFSKVQWGAWWNWDPRQTSFLLVMMIVSAYFALRAAFDDPHKRAMNAAAYALSAILPLVFLIYVYPRLPMVVSLHPNVLKDGSLDPTYRTVLLSMLILTGIGCGFLYRLRVQAAILSLQLENLNAELANRGRRSARSAVRVVPVRAGDST